MTQTTQDDSMETMGAIVRRIVLRELELIDAMPMLTDESVDRLAKLALVMQRIGVKASGATGNPAEGLSNDQLMRRAG